MRHLGNYKSTSTVTFSLGENKEFSKYNNGLELDIGVVPVWEIIFYLTFSAYSELEVKLHDIDRENIGYGLSLNGASKLLKCIAMEDIKTVGFELGKGHIYRGYFQAVKRGGSIFLEVMTEQEYSKQASFLQ